MILRPDTDDPTGRSLKSLNVPSKEIVANANHKVIPMQNHNITPLRVKEVYKRGVHFNPRKGPQQYTIFCCKTQKDTVQRKKLKPL